MKGADFGWISLFKNNLECYKDFYCRKVVPPELKLHGILSDCKVKYIEFKFATKQFQFPNCLDGIQNLDLTYAQKHNIKTQTLKILSLTV